MARAFIRNTNSEPADAGLSPVQIEGISLWEASNNRISGVCPGTSVTLSDPEVAGHNRIEVHLDNAWFTAYLQALSASKSQ